MFQIHQDYHDRTIKLDVDELEEEMEEGVMHGDHGEYYDEEGEELVVSLLMLKRFIFD